MLRCRDLLSLPTMTKAKLISGEGGLDNGIRWSYKAENMNIADWVHGQELLIVSTSVIHSPNFDLHQLIKEAIRLKLSGVILLIGEEFISSISRKTLKLANDNNLPVFSLPGDIPLVDIFEELGHAIVYQENASKNKDLLSELIFDRNVNEKMFVSQAALQGYIVNSSQRIFMIHLNLPDSNINKGIVSNLAAQLKTLFFNLDCSVLVSHFHLNIIGLVGEPAVPLLTNIFNEFIDDLNSRQCNVKCQIGVGGSYNEINLLRNSFEEASMSLKFANPIQWFDNLGFIKVLMNADNHKIMHEFMDEVLGNVIRYDSETNSELMITLAAYFDSNESMKDAAEILYVHHNTVKYRLQKIEELSHRSPFISSEKLELYNAVLIWKITESV